MLIGSHHAQEGCHLLRVRRSGIAVMVAPERNANPRRLCFVVGITRVNISIRERSPREYEAHFFGVRRNRVKVHEL